MPLLTFSEGLNTVDNTLVKFVQSGVQVSDFSDSVSLSVSDSLIIEPIDDDATKGTALTIKSEGSVVTESTTGRTVVIQGSPYGVRIDAGGSLFLRDALVEPEKGAVYISSGQSSVDLGNGSDYGSNSIWKKEGPADCDGDGRRRHLSDRSRFWCNRGLPN